MQQRRTVFALSDCVPLYVKVLVQINVYNTLVYFVKRLIRGNETNVLFLD